MPITPYKDWKVKLERAHYSKVQSGKITVCSKFCDCYMKLFLEILYFKQGKYCVSKV